jgi:hypothetical protein
MESAPPHPDIPANVVDVWQTMIDSMSDLLSMTRVTIKHLEPSQLEVLEALKEAIEGHLALIRALGSLERRNSDLARTISQTKTLRGLLPVCASCKKIRNEYGYWEAIEDYIEQRSEAAFTHSVCPECENRLYPELNLGD